MQHDVKLRMNKKKVLGGNCEEIHLKSRHLFSFLIRYIYFSDEKVY